MDIRLWHKGPITQAHLGFDVSDQGMDQSFIIHWAPINYAPAMNQIMANVWKRQPREDRPPCPYEEFILVEGRGLSEVNITNKFITCCQE